MLASVSALSPSLLFRGFPTTSPVRRYVGFSALLSFLRTTRIPPGGPVFNEEPFQVSKGLPPPPCRFCRGEAA